MAKKYLSIIRELEKETFQKIRRDENYLCPKPFGGLQATDFDAGNWIKLSGKRKIIKGIIFELRDDAEILDIASEADFAIIAKNYPLNEGIDFEALSEHYDGIFIHYNKMPFNYLARLYNMDTLHLFNLKCIKYYQNITLKKGKEDPINISDPKKISVPKLEFFEFKDYVTNFFWEIVNENEEKSHPLTYEEYLKFTKDLEIDVYAIIIFVLDMSLKNLIEAYGFKKAFFIVIAVVGNLLRAYYDSDKLNIAKPKML